MVDLQYNNLEFMMPVLKAIESYFPKDVLTNEMLERDFPEWSVEKISAKIGISTRHISNNETVSSMAISACRKLFMQSQLKPELVDFILLCTQSPDYILPTTACIIQNEIGVPTSAGAIDFNQGCSGYVYGLSLAKGLICAGIAKNILLITSEAYTKHIHPLDKSNRAIFGDAATASWIGTGEGLEIDQFVLGTDGKGAQNLIIKNGGSKYPYCTAKSSVSNNDSYAEDNHLYMNGSEIFNFTLESIPNLVQSTLSINELQITELNYFVFHQANTFMLKHLMKKIGIESDKFPIYMEKTGNTVSSSIPLVLEKLMRDDKIKNGNKILLAGFGVGYSWGSVVLNYKKYE